MPPGIMKVRAAPKRVHSPSCTHVTMDRVFVGKGAQCFACGHAPSLGFLYECREYCSPVPHSVLSEPDVIDGGGSQKSSLRRELEEIGMSESVIAAAEGGHYTTQELAQLKCSKSRLNWAVTAAIHRAQSANARAHLTGTGGATNGTAGGDVLQGCHYRACHTCRPYFRERIYISFGAVFSNSFTPLTPLDLSSLSTKPAQVVSKIGLRPSSDPTGLPKNSFASAQTSTDSILVAPPTPESSISTFRTTQSDMEDLDSTRHHRQRFYGLGHRSSADIARDISQDMSRRPFFSRLGLKTALQGIFGWSRDSSSEGSNITLPLPRTGQVRDLSKASPMGEFDMGALRRVKWQKERHDLRHSVSNQHDRASAATNVQQQPIRATSGDSEVGSSESDFTVYSCVSEGSEVEVDGGVALTEEAVETHTPDILSHANLDETDESNDTTQSEALESILTQV